MVLAGSVALALLLGYVLSVVSLVRMRRMLMRLAPSRTKER
jgi:hypothetical protein